MWIIKRLNKSLLIFNMNILFLIAGVGILFFIAFYKEDTFTQTIAGFFAGLLIGLSFTI